MAPVYLASSMPGSPFFAMDDGLGLVLKLPAWQLGMLVTSASLPRTSDGKYRHLESSNLGR